MSDANLKTGRGRGRPKKHDGGVVLDSRLPRVDRLCLGFGEDHYFASTGPSHRRCGHCEDRLRTANYGRLAFNRVSGGPPE